jgi:lysylphosphatidylglycerol synthetase-like protein (DUF2156 family)
MRAASFFEECFLRSGAYATSFSSAFDRDLQRFATPAGYLAFETVPALSVTVAFFDPVLATRANDADASRALLRTFLSAHPRSVFLHCGPAFAAVLADTGLLINPYGVENRVALPLSLHGSRMRGLRREVQAARQGGVRIEEVSETRDAPVWDELRAVDQRWLASRVLGIEVRRGTRRAVRRPEPHTTKVMARDGRGRALGWACFDHVCEQGAVVGVGLSVLRADPSAAGVRTLLALEGARLCEARLTSLRFLDLGLSPLAPVPDGMDWSPLAVCADDVACAAEPQRSPAVDALLSAAFRWGTQLYNTQGLAAWKRKWRPREGLAYVGVQSGLPLRELLAVLWLLLV